MIRDGVAFVCAALERGERVLVHCQYGIGRSVLLGLCVLVARGLAPLEALACAKAARPVAAPGALPARVADGEGRRIPLLHVHFAPAHPA